jgi:hypothetical protein
MPVSVSRGYYASEKRTLMKKKSPVRSVTSGQNVLWPDCVNYPDASPSLASGVIFAWVVPFKNFLPRGAKIGLIMRHLEPDVGSSEWARQERS